MKPFASVAGIEAQPLTVGVYKHGPWYVHGELVDDTLLSGKVEVCIGSLKLVGTVTQYHLWGMRGHVRVCGGAAGWAKSVYPQHYHSDAGVKTSLVATDLARLVGETLGRIEPARAIVGTAFTRAYGLAARALTLATTPTSWWVDYDGITHIADRPPAEVVGDYDVLGMVDGEVTIATDDLSIIGVGSIIRGKLKVPVVAWSVEYSVRGGEVRAFVRGSPL